MGAIVGAGGTLLTARGQHRRTVESERKKETAAREKCAAQKISSLVARWAKLVEEGGIRNDDDAWVKRGNEMFRVSEEIRVEAFYLPTEVRARVDLARAALEEAESLSQEGFFYQSPSSIARHVASDTHELLAAVARDTNPHPELSETMKRLGFALQDQDDQRHEFFAEELQRSDDAKRQWLVNHPEASTADSNAAN
ncbi:MAG: hypothetical protein QOI03_2418 [Solirubrobacteraceae bacterium]|nr:hypothetical protein [Solirubrobacteraceae bacterium]